MSNLDQLLFDRKVKKSKEFLSELFERYGQQLYLFCTKRWKIEEDAVWDLIYKTLYKIMDVKDKYQFESKEKFQGFLFTTFINYVKNYFRDNKAQLNFHISEINEEITQISAGTSEESPSTGNQYMIALTEVLEELEDWQRILVLMRSDGCSYSEIAKFIDKPENQLKVYYQRIKEQITKKIYGKQQ